MRYQSVLPSNSIQEELPRERLYNALVKLLLRHLGSSPSLACLRMDNRVLASVAWSVASIGGRWNHMNGVDFLYMVSYEAPQTINNVFLLAILVGSLPSLAKHASLILVRRHA